MKARGFRLRHFLGFAKHFARPGKIEPALGHEFVHGLEHIVRAIDVGVERGECVFERGIHKALRREVITLVRLHCADHIVNARKTFERRGMEFDFVLQVGDAPEAMLGIFQRDSPDNAVYVIALVQQKFRQIRAILPGDAGDQCCFRHERGRPF